MSDDTISAAPPDQAPRVPGALPLLGEKAVPFSEVSAHRATLEQAYMELTRDALEFRPADPVTGPAEEVAR